ncbi:MAG TPA: saccharopine dehydrogenase C-terminal domain-containing protein [Flavitalea sp.]|nr:saccharopine dehydrogenase C-terminal domain-containing protein [Flavitalea sp.]
MAAKKILLLLSSDRFAFPLIRYLAEEGKTFGWKTRVGCMFDPGIGKRIREENFATEVSFIDITKFQECDQAIRKSDIVIAQVTDNVLLQIADSCIAYRKTLLSPARLNRQMALKKTLAKENNVLILMDCGFAPGLDHITAKKAIDNIRAKGGKITSFKTYSGSFIPESYHDNPWEFKFAEPVADVMTWGRHNNRHLLQGRLHHIPYHRLFERSEQINIRDVENTIVIPEGDSLYYRKIYELVDAHTVIKGKLARKGFDRMWDLLIRLGFTDTVSKIDLGGEGSFYSFLESLLPYSGSSNLEQRLQEYTGADMEDIEKLKSLGLFESSWVEGYREITPAIILQCLLEKRLAPQPEDKDCVVMEHQLGYELRDEHYEFRATFISQGENQKDSALAKAIGLTCGAAAKAVLLGSISVKGLHIPITRDIYDPILNELSDLGVAFHFGDAKVEVAQPAN